MTEESIKATVVRLTQDLLNSVASSDYTTYEHLCASDLTCFEPETSGNLVEGLAFHRFFFVPHEETSPKDLKLNTICSPHVRVLGGGSCAIISYGRLVQTSSGLSASQETRVWQRLSCGSW
eukprot:CAMPEP_0119300592 /NCGR_PEP_ID=MMETSP1333-20130426/2517_1 /TAXON_ID=418940 /ORGANISM="Scyphosphaera apsteinii, Strain RCC1455" /LENGTH=120 /DNA_ID=CAMNT_0007302419 /DNA_START=60 /DNA_END=419 /DNA_ORIENTATION=+